MTAERKDGKAGPTIIGCLLVLSAVFKRARKLGLISESPMLGLDESDRPSPERKTKPLTQGR